MVTRIPSYRYHKARACAVVTLGGRNHYLGTYNSPASREKYHRLIAEYLSAPLPSLAAESPSSTPLTVTELISAYWKFAKTHYVKYGKPTSEIAALRSVLRFLRRLYGSTQAREFSPKRLKALREAMVGHKITRRFKAIDPGTGTVIRREKVLDQGLCRRTINKQIGRIKRVFAWAVEEELVDVAVHAALLRVRGLRRNETNAREKPRVRPVSQNDIEAVLLRLPPVVRSMVEVQLLSGARPQEVVFMRGEDIVRDGPVWEYRPRRYKTEHHNPDSDPDRDRVIFLGPRAQAVLTPILELHPGGYLFSPAAAEEARNAAKRRARKSPMTPSQAARRPKGRAHAPIRDHYDVASYRRAIRRACEKAGILVWCPNRLRHSRLSEIRKRFSLEASRVCAGHREVGVTQIYAEQDHELARKVMVEIG